MPAPRKYPLELMERGARMVVELIQPQVQDWLAGQFAQTYSDLGAFGAGAV